MMSLFSSSAVDANRQLVDAQKTPSSSVKASVLSSALLPNGKRLIWADTEPETESVEAVVMEKKDGEIAVKVPLLKDQIDEVKSTLTSIPVSAGLKRAMGKKTNSMRQKGAKGDGVVFSLETIPARLFKPIGSANQIYTIPQEYLLGTALTANNTVPTFASFNFQVSSLDQISSLTALFDQYRIKQVECWIAPKLGPIQTPGNNLASVIDYDDSAALTTYAQALDYVNCCSSNGSLAHYRKFVPHCAVAAYSGTFVSFANVAAPWIDAASTSVQHYGLKLASTVSVPATFNYDVTVRLLTEWRNAR